MLIVAEIGQNHCGDMDLAKKLIRLAKENGADLVKFQLYDSLKLYGEYQETELTREQAFDLFNFGQETGIEVFFSVFDVERVRWCEEMGVKRYKVANRDIDDSLKREIRLTKKPVIVSIGILRTVPQYDWANRASFLYCVPKYPTELGELHFKQINFSVYSGFSDHTVGLDAARVALARGARIIEKHFAIDHNTGVDAPWSMTPDELKELRRWADVVETCI